MRANEIGVLKQPIACVPANPAFPAAACQGFEVAQLTVGVPGAGAVGWPGGRLFGG